MSDDFEEHSNDKDRKHIKISTFSAMKATNLGTHVSIYFRPKESGKKLIIQCW